MHNNVGATCLVSVPEFKRTRPFETLGVILGIIFLVFGVIAFIEAYYSNKKRHELIEKLKYIKAKPRVEI